MARSAKVDPQKSEHFNFSVYPWHAEQRDSFVLQKENDRLPHACLFFGLRGLGKFDFATALAAFVLCETPMGSGACGQCKSCGLLQGFTHPDLKIIRAEEGASVIKVDQIRALGDFARKTAQRSGYRIIIIDKAEMLNLASANALLKNLEEPGSATLLILVSNSPDSLLATIRSRCYKVAFSTPSAEQAVEWINSTVNDAGLSRQLLREANGAPLMALENFQSSFYQDRGDILQELIALLSGQSDPIDVAAKWKDFPVSALLDFWYEGIVDVSKLQRGVDSAFIQNVSNITHLSQLESLLSKERLLAFLDELLENISLIKSGFNVNQQLFVENLLLSWVQAGRK